MFLIFVYFIIKQMFKMTICNFITSITYIYNAFDWCTLSKFQEYCESHHMRSLSCWWAHFECRQGLRTKLSTWKSP